MSRAGEWFFFLLQRIDRLNEKIALHLGKLRAEMRSELSGLRDERNTLRAEMNAAAPALRGEVCAAAAALRGEVSAALPGTRWEPGRMQRSLAGMMRWAITLMLACLGVMAGVLVAA